MLWLPPPWCLDLERDRERDLERDDLWWCLWCFDEDEWWCDERREMTEPPSQSQKPIFACKSSFWQLTPLDNIYI